MRNLFNFIMGICSSNSHYQLQSVPSELSFFPIYLYFPCSFSLSLSLFFTLSFPLSLSFSPSLQSSLFHSLLSLLTLSLFFTLSLSHHLSLSLPFFRALYLTDFFLSPFYLMDILLSISFSLSLVCSPISSSYMEAFFHAPLIYGLDINDNQIPAHRKLILPQLASYGRPVWNNSGKTFLREQLNH